MVSVKKKRGTKRPHKSLQQKLKIKSAKKAAVKKLVWYVSTNSME
jgi:hypothetical protein